MTSAAPSIERAAPAADYRVHAAAAMPGLQYQHHQAGMPPPPPSQVFAAESAIQSRGTVQAPPALHHQQQYYHHQEQQPTDCANYGWQVQQLVSVFHLFFKDAHIR